MKSIIIGGGKVGYFLLKTLKDRNYHVTMIERDKNTCSKLADDIEADIICGDGTDLDVLIDAGIEEAEIIAAVTGSDEENLIICEIAKINFDINKTIARINNPKNTTMFKALGVDKTVCSTEVIANLIEFEFDRDNFKIMQTFERGAMLLVEISIEDNSPWCNCFIRDLQLPVECIIVSILRNEKIIYPRGDNQILENDRVLMISNNNVLQEIKKRFRNGGAHHEKQKK